MIYMSAERFVINWLIWSFKVIRQKRGIVYLCFTSHATIFQLFYVTAQMCRRTKDEVVPTVGLPTP